MNTFLSDFKRAAAHQHHNQYFHVMLIRNKNYRYQNDMISAQWLTFLDKMGHIMKIFLKP